MGGKVAKVQINSSTAVEKDSRRRNSFAYNITKFLKHEEENFDSLVEAVRKERERIADKAQANIRDQKAVALGNMRELRNQVVSNFRGIMRKYKNEWGGNTLMHIVCQEGYVPMLEFLLEEKNHPEFDHVPVDIDVLNERKRTPLFLVFTPPFLTYTGSQNGLKPNGTPIAVQPEGVVSSFDWIRPGGPAQREQLVRMLVERGADVKRSDFHGYTCLHYACMWGWTPIASYLVSKGADVNATTIHGRSPLFCASEFLHHLTVAYLVTVPGIHLDLVDLEGCSALLCTSLVEGGVRTAEVLLKAGADPNIESRQHKTALSEACRAQDMPMVNLLLDHKAQRIGSSFALLKGDAAVQLHNRIVAEEKAAELEAARLEEERKKKAEDGMLDMATQGFRRKSPWGQWVQYNDKRGRGVFYYNMVSRQSQWDEPKDYVRKKGVLPKDATFGMSFYH